MEKQQIQLLGAESDTDADRTSSKRRTDHKGMLLTIVTANEAGAAGNWTPHLQIQGKDGTWVTAWSAAATISADGTYQYLFYPGTAVGPYTEYIDTVLPYAWRLFLEYAAGTPGVDTIDTEAFADLIP